VCQMLQGLPHTHRGRHHCRNQEKRQTEDPTLAEARISEDCFYYCSERNNVVVLFGTLKVQSFILTEVSDCGLLIVVIVWSWSMARGSLHPGSTGI